MDFNNKKLIAKYKTWVGVQVAFYDFLFKMSIDMPAEKFNRQHLEELIKDCTVQERLYNKSIVKIYEMFDTPEEAWCAFLNVEV